MTTILNIDTALDTASVCLAREGAVLQLLTNINQKDHASWLHGAIKQVLQTGGHTLNDIDAIAVSIGPGSYTGLRVGLSTAKGLCYALDKPLISVTTLEMLVNAAGNIKADFVCPVIDARRLEVFTVTYDKKLGIYSIPEALIVEPNSFMTILEKGTVLFVGNAANKLQKYIVHSNASFNSLTADASHMAFISLEKYMTKKFEDVAYIEPFYIKEFYSPRNNLQK